MLRFPRDPASISCTRKQSKGEQETYYVKIKMISSGIREEECIPLLFYLCLGRCIRWGKVVMASEEVVLDTAKEEVVIVTGIDCPPSLLPLPSTLHRFCHVPMDRPYVVVVAVDAAVLVVTVGAIPMTLSM